MPELTGKGTLRMFDAQGRLLRAMEIGDVGAFDVDMGAFMPGVYAVRVTVGDRVGTSRIVRL
jgi:hypothetical protein